MRTLLIALAALSLSAADLPTKFRSAEGTDSSAGELRDWWKRYGDPQLDALVAKGIAGNKDLQIAASRVIQARTSSRVTRADQLPAVNSTGNVSRVRGGVNQGVIHAQSGSSLISAYETGVFQNGFDASWELDFFGAKKNATKAAVADANGTEEARRNVLLVVLSEICRNYMEVRGFDNRLAILRRNVALQQDSLDLIRVRAEAGLATGLDVERQAALVAASQASVPVLEAGRAEGVYKLAVLLGQTPGQLDSELKNVVKLPVPPAVISTGLPSELLVRRPDVREAQEAIVAQVARYGVSRADLYPKIRLTGTMGRQAASVDGLTLGGGNFFSFGPSVSLPVFSGGRIKANIALQDEKLQSAKLQYEAVVLASMQDVQIALTAYDREQERLRRLSESADASRKAVELSQELYSRGLADFLSVLDAQRSLLETEALLEESRVAVVTDSVALFKALGGGWN